MHAITAVDEPFTGYQQARAYTFRATRTTWAVRPDAAARADGAPGVPDFPARNRFIAPGACVLEGRAWSGFAPVVAVEVSTDGGETWAEAELDGAESRWAWRGWRFRWDASPGTHELRCRAWDTDGNVQPAEPEWNVGTCEQRGAAACPSRSRE